MRLPRLLSILLACAAPTPALHAEATWYAVKSPHFTVISDDSERAARNVANQFEQMRYVFTTRFGDRLRSGAPLTIFAARDVNTYRDLAPIEWKRSGSQVAGFFFTGWEQQFALIRMDGMNGVEDMSGDPIAVVYHEYTHSVMHANMHWLPVWLDEGLAEFYGYTRFENHKIYIGAPTIRFQELRARPSLLPIDTMLGVRQNSPLYKGNADTQLFYAEAWAMVHFMTFGPNMDGGRKLDAFLQAIEAGANQKQAFVKVFGDEDQFLNALSQYTTKLGFSAAVIPPSPVLDPKTFTAERLSPAQAAYEQARFHLASHDHPGGITLLHRALQLDPNLAAAHQDLGFDDFDEGNDVAAGEQWEQALQEDPNLYRALFASTMSGSPLLSRPPAAQAQARTALERVTTIEPDFAAAWIELALLAWHDGQIQLAYNDAQTAESLAPWRAGYHLLSADILLHGNQPVLAADSARFVARHWSGPDHDEAVDLLKQVPPAARGSDPVPSYDISSAFRVVRGTLTDESCDDTMHTIRMTLAPENGGAPMSFTSAGAMDIGFSDTFWWGEDHFSRCHHLAGHAAVLAYQPQGDNNLVVDLEVRDELPGTAKPAPAVAAAPGASH